VKTYSRVQRIDTGCCLRENTAITKRVPEEG
jgi:hypothetical protein